MLREFQRQPTAAVRSCPPAMFRARGRDQLVPMSTSSVVEVGFPQVCGPAHLPPGRGVAPQTTSRPPGMSRCTLLGHNVLFWTILPPRTPRGTGGAAQRGGSGRSGASLAPPDIKSTERSGVAASTIASARQGTELRRETVQLHQVGTDLIALGFTPDLTISSLVAQRMSTTGRFSRIMVPIPKLPGSLSLTIICPG